MPLYEYQCDECGHRFEQIQKFSDPQVQKCPSCGGPVHKLLSSPAIQFKGSGWYITDYAKKDSSAGKSEGGEKGGESSAKKADTKAETKTESKSETKSETKTESSKS
jgi:putative FmdB family regulatory protein